jgi:hypothetical protein
LGNESLEDLGNSSVRRHLDRDSAIAASKEQQRLKVRRQILKRHICRHRRVGDERIEDGTVILLHSLVADAPRLDRPLLESFRFVHHQVGVKEQLGSNSMTGRTGTEVTVKGEMFRRQLRHGKACRWIAVVGGELLLGPFLNRRFHADHREHAPSPSK